METSEVRRRVRAAIERARQAAADRRAAADAANNAYPSFLAQVAGPVVQQFASALRAEGRLFKVFAPANGLRLMSEHSSDDYIEFSLDTSADTPTVVGRVSRGRGRRLVNTERPIREGAPVESLTEEDVLDFLSREIVAFVER